MFLREHVESHCHVKRRAIKYSPLCLFCPIKPISNMFKPTICTEQAIAKVTGRMDFHSMIQETRLEGCPLVCDPKYTWQIYRGPRQASWALLDSKFIAETLELTPWGSVVGWLSPLCNLSNWCVWSWVQKCWCREPLSPHCTHCHILRG